MKRAEGLDTYYGEGLFYPKMKAWDFIYVKVAHGKKSFFDPVNDKTKKIIEASEDIPIKGIYSYLLANNDKNHWMFQADAILQAYFYIQDTMGIEIDFFAPDIEGTYNKVLQGLNWVYPKGFGAMIYEIMKYVAKEIGKPILPYMSKSTYHECFIWHGYTFIKDYDLIIANYPCKKWNDTLYEVPTNSELWNPALPAGVTDWKIWQYHEGYPSQGITDSRAIDANVWNGTREDMLAYFEKEEATPPLSDYDRGKADGLEYALKKNEAYRHELEEAQK